MTFALLAGAALASVCVLSGQQLSPLHETADAGWGEVVADRPGFGVAPDVLAQGLVQFEGGFSFTSEADRSTVSRTLMWGSPLARIGIGKRTELRFGGDGFLSSRVEGEGFRDRARGLADIGVGAKVALFNGHGVIPALSVIPTLSLPTGSPGFSHAAVEPGVVLAWSTSLPAKFSAGGSLGYALVSGAAAGRTAHRTHALSLGHPLQAGFSGYVEVYNDDPVGAGNAAWLWDGGVTHGLGRNAVFDVTLGRKFAAPTSCWFFSMGLVFRTATFKHLMLARD